ncbi:Serine carboxypeptidases (lysosomal cathepsin A) [Handroanthus impetiginosus]|uniref:Serine carboxypeptidases (Lysosomal cathepsin A) n=1 Tax=Handroanthus impetiginosus TaxID=429701 RepID=A0A2G9GGV3_9LAMI|nr:Serine carboxypeptidases (lysosomal cathepsin A) [Handroanthus impetiginosus]
MKSFISLPVFFLVLIKTTSLQSIIKTLPGYPGPLPFKLETGYISVGEDDEIELFYYFIESERDPETDPLLFWQTGGPGCSGFSGLVIEIGPLAFDLESFDGSFPSLIINPYSWTKVASIIFIDAPVGTGFSYSTTSKGYLTSDTKTANDNYLFLRKWLLKHPKFLKNCLYVAGDSYGGKITTMVASEIAKGIEAELQPHMLFQGYIIGNSKTEGQKDDNEKIPYAHRMALISDEYFELAKSSCHGDYVNLDPNNYKCLYALQLIKECTKRIDEAHILEPKCKFVSPKPIDFLSGRLFMEDDPIDLILLSKQERPWCRGYNYVPTYIWANNETVQEALHIRKGTITNWKRCNNSLSYEEDVESIFRHHQVLNEKGYQALAYSGDHDMLIPYMSTLKWIRSLNLTVDDEWRPWYAGGQIAGYTEKYKKNQAYITFATVKGGGHTALEYKPKECLIMIERWLSLFPL